MAKAVDVIEIPRTGEKLTFLRRPRDTQGEVLEMEFFAREFALVAARAHIHTKSEERLEVVAGTARVRTGRKEQVLGPARRWSFQRAWRTLFNARGRSFCTFAFRCGPR